VFALEDRAAIVTGGAAGVGRSLAGALARAGAVVTICDTRPDVEQVAAELSRGVGHKLTGIAADASQPDDVRRVVDHAACVRPL
jgi:NAD(P)-dependent dehydrogenase (short-subunit alcohol dehydrogenase family)